jgi:cation diffusion facilitator family transporter
MQITRDHEPQPAKNNLYRKAIIITLFGNLLLAVSKGIVAWLSGSAALYADAANSISDVLYSVLIVIGLWMAQQPPDISHPQGHSRFEPLVGLMVTFSMAFAGFKAAQTALVRFLEGGLAVEPGLPVVVLIASALVKVGMFFVIRKLAKELNSPTLQTTAKDNLSDVLTSLAAFFGTVGSFLWSPLLDPIAGFLVAIWIFRAAWEAGKENLGFLTGAGASEELRQQIIDTASLVPGVIEVHQVITEYVGPSLIVDLHINVNGDLTLKDAHKISDKVIENLETIPEVDRAYVHLEPEGWT